MTRTERRLANLVRRYPGITDEAITDMVSEGAVAVLGSMVKTRQIERRERGDTSGYYPPSWQGKTAGSGVVAGPVTIGRGYACWPTRNNPPPGTGHLRHNRNEPLHADTNLSPET